MYHLAEKKSKLKIKSLKLKNFRNYELLNLEFDGSTNIFYGDNAQGKTNILEAVYLSGTTKSHRGSKDRDMIRFGAEESHIEVIAYRQDAMETLDIWDLQLVQYGNAIIARRKQFVDEMNEIVSGIHKKLTGGKEEIRLIYEPSTKNMSLEQALEMNRQRDIRMKSTSVGPHRDDVCFMVGNLDIRRFGSQGQQRTAALSLKLAEIELVKRVIGDTPVLLLDDVLSELDKHRQNYLLDSIHDIQTLITCTGVDEFVNHRFEVNKVFHVQNGQVIKEN